METLSFRMGNPLMDLFREYLIGSVLIQGFVF